MPFPILTALSAASTAYSLGKQLFGRRKSFGDTEYGRKLKRLSERGINTTPITSQISKDLAATGQQAKVDLKGRLISQGMGGSIAGQRAITNVDVSRMDQLQKAIRKVKTENEKLKAKYALEYASQGSQYDLAQQQSEEAATSDLLGTSASLLYEQLNPQQNYGQMLLEAQTTGANNPYRPEVPLQAPPNTVMPQALQPDRPEVALQAPPDYIMPKPVTGTLQDLSIQGNPRGQRVTPWIETGDPSTIDYRRLSPESIRMLLYMINKRK